jgi:hypothetical protein
MPLFFFVVTRGGACKVALVRVVRVVMVAVVMVMVVMLVVSEVVREVVVKCTVLAWKTRDKEIYLTLSSKCT